MAWVTGSPCVALKLQYRPRVKCVTAPTSDATAVEATYQSLAHSVRPTSAPKSKIVATNDAACDLRKEFQVLGRLTTFTRPRTRSEPGPPERPRLAGRFREAGTRPTRWPRARRRRARRAADRPGA